MSRSVRKFPRIGNVNQVSLKRWRQNYNRAHRRIEKVRLNIEHEDYQPLHPHDSGLGNIYNSPPDGFHYFDPKPNARYCAHNVFKPFERLNELKKDFIRFMRKK